MPLLIVAMHTSAEAEISPILAARMRRGAEIGAALVVALGACVLVGWATGTAWLTHLGWDGFPVKPNAAVALVLAGMALLASPRGAWGAAVASVLGGMVAGIGLLTLAESIAHRSIIDQMLFPQPGGSGLIVPAGRMSPLAAACFVLLGTALGAGRRDRLRRVLAGLMVLVIVPILSEHALGFFLVTWTLAPYTAIALPTAAALLVLAGAVFLLHPTGGLAAIAASDTAGGYLARRLVPAGILSPLVVAPFVHLGERFGLYGPGVRVALILAVSCVATTAVIVLAARALHAIDADRRRSSEQAQAADRRKDEFLAMLGHELRNPLAPISTAIELARMRGYRECDREWQVMERQVKHLSRLVDDLLDVSRITRGTVELRRRPVELARVVAVAVEIASPLLEQRVSRLSLQVPPTGLRVDADEERLAQAIAHLVTNAAKYGERGGRVEVSASREAGEVVISVRDDGPGIEPELLARIFEPFVQSSRPIDRAEGGLGIGLSIVRSLVELHGGSVRARSDGLGRGSEFSIRLPALAGAIRRPLTPIPFEPASGGPFRRVLVVDDNRDAAELLADSLRTMGHEVFAAFDGPGALEALVAFTPEVGLLDIGLPVMDGYELARRLRQALGREVRLVAVTGYGQEGDHARSLEAGFDEHVVKPVELETIRKIVAGPSPVVPAGARRRA